MEDPKILIMQAVQKGLRNCFPESEVIRYGSTLKMDFTYMGEKSLTNKIFKISISEVE